MSIYDDDYPPDYPLDDDVVDATYDEPQGEVWEEGGEDDFPPGYFGEDNEPDNTKYPILGTPDDDEDDE